MTTNKQISGWKASVQKRKQRLYRYITPKHLRHKLLSANLSKELRKKYQRRSLPLRKGDNVLVMCGKFKNIKGKITEVNLFKLKVYVEKVSRKKSDGSQVQLPIDPSNVQIIELVTDKKRTKMLERKMIGEKK